MSIAAFNKVVTIRSTTSSTNHELPATNATLTLAGDLLDDTDMSSTGFRSKTIGLQDWSLAAPSNFDTSNVALTVARQAWQSRTRVLMRYLPNGTAGFQGIAFVETYTLSGDVGGLETVDINLQADSALSTV
jgi:predicted secreted protein